MAKQNLQTNLIGRKVRIKNLNEFWGRKAEENSLSASILPKEYRGKIAEIVGAYVEDKALVLCLSVDGELWDGVNPTKTILQEQSDEA